MTHNAEDAVQLEANQRVGLVLNDKWTLDALIGVGGMAAVYAATHRNQSRVAIKILHAQLSMNRVFRERFLREGYAANSVGHAGVVRVHDDDVTKDGCAFLVMELLEGEGLYERWVRKGQKLPVQEVLGITHSMLDVLKAAHARDIIHRDLKPENLFLTRDGTLKILDFGIARLRGFGSAGSGTMAGSPMGTPSFMPPEQALGHWDKVDATSDLWAVGATMFTLLTGKYVHDANTMSESLVMAATRTAPSLASVAKEIPAPVVELVDRALAFDKAVRWPDAQAMQESLLRVHAQLTGGTAPEMPASRVAISARSEDQPAPSQVALTVGAPSSPDGQKVHKGTLLGTGPATDPTLVNPADTPASAQPLMQATTTTRAIELGILTDSRKRQRRWLALSLGATAVVAVGLYFLLGSSEESATQPDVSAVQAAALALTTHSDPTPAAETPAAPESPAVPSVSLTDAAESSEKATAGATQAGTAKPAKAGSGKPVKSPTKSPAAKPPLAKPPAASKPPPHKPAPQEPSKPPKPPRDPFSARQ